MMMMMMMVIAVMIMIVGSDNDGAENTRRTDGVHLHLQCIAINWLWKL